MSEKEQVQVHQLTSQVGGATEDEGPAMDVHKDRSPERAEVGAGVGGGTGTSSRSNGITWPQGPGAL